MAPKEGTHWCSCDRCHGGQRVSKSTFYAHGNSVKRTSQLISERTRDLILSLPQTSKAPRTRRQRKRRAEEVGTGDGDLAEGSRRAESVCTQLDAPYMRLELNDSHEICI